jgi:hypothetical protein
MLEDWIKSLNNAKAARLAPRAAPRKNYGKRKDIDRPAHGLESVAAMPFLFRSIRLERIEHERRRTCHALQA